MVIGIGTVVAMNYPDFTLRLYGVLFILVGINIMFYVPVMRANQSVENDKVQ
ncbi:MAG: hypothetical protein ACOVSR_13995 [Bacteroidia bacterium]